MKIELPEQMVIARAAHLREEWLSALENATDDPVELDPSAVAKIDGTGVALLGALVKELESRDKAFQWSAENEVLSIAANDMGMAQHLHLSSH